MIVTNMTRQTRVANKVFVAKSFLDRLKGLMGTPPLQAGEGFLLPYCMGIHTFGMNYPIDVIYLNKSSEVIALLENLKPNSLGLVKFTSCAVLEFPVGTIRKSKTQLGDQIAINGAGELIEPAVVKPIPCFRLI